MRRPVTLLSLVLVASLVTGCILPIAYTENTSPRIIGRLLRSDSTPITGVRVAVAKAVTDSACVARVETTTDSGGRFELPGTQERRRGVLIFPPMERLFNAYSLCVGMPDKRRDNVYSGRFSLGASPPFDTLGCFAWRWEDRRRTTCASTRERTILTGGHWTDSTGVSGFYRVILVEDAVPVAERRRKLVETGPFAYVQWIQSRDTAVSQDSARYLVRATSALPIDHRNLWAASQMELWRDDKEWRVALTGLRHEFMNDFGRGEQQFSLGGPGVVARSASVTVAKSDSVPGAVAAAESPQLPLGRVPAGSRLRITYADGRRIEARLASVGDTSVAVRAMKGDTTTRTMTFAELRAISQLSARVFRTDENRMRFTGAAVGGAAGAIVGAALQHTGRMFNGRPDDGNMAYYVSSHAFLGALFGYMIGPIVNGRHWVSIRIP